LPSGFDRVGVVLVSALSVGIGFLIAVGSDSPRKG